MGILRDGGEKEEEVGMGKSEEKGEEMKGEGGMEKGGRR